MKKLSIRLIALILAVVMLSGCGLLEEYQRLQELYYGAETAFSDMEYQRPDLDDFLACQQQCLALAEAGTDLDALVKAISATYDAYDHFFTQYTLAHIHSCMDMSDSYWVKEYDWCLEASCEMDAGLDRMLYALADSPLREELEDEDLFGPGYFDAYQGDSLWDEEMTAMLEEESKLVGRYEELLMELPDWDDPAYGDAAMELADLYAELIVLRQEQADWAGYEDYVAFANDFYYGRDYTPRQEQAYLEQIRQRLAPLYRQVSAMDPADLGYEWAGERQTFRYVARAAENIGGMVAEAFDVMERLELYDISPGRNKYPASFEVYLWDYDLPFAFVDPEESNYDHLSFAHEFGHFCNDYASYGTMLNIDSAEVLSQGMEYLTLCYADDGGALTRMKMADSLCTYVEQAAYSAFEQAAYGLTGAELTGENLMDLYEEVTAGYGFDAWEYDGTEMVGITHLYSYPCYVFSYVVSNDAAMQIYQMELEDPGAGLVLYEENLTASAWSLGEFLEEAGLESPFAENRLDAVEEIFRQTFG